MSLVRHFDDLCRFNVLLDNSDLEFLNFVKSQEEWRKRSELDHQRMISLLNLEKVEKNKLETKLEYCRRMFSQEIEKRKEIEREKDILEMQLGLIKEILADTNLVNEQTRAKLAFLNASPKCYSTNEQSVGSSILSPSDFDVTEEELFNNTRPKRSKFNGPITAESKIEKLATKHRRSISEPSAPTQVPAWMKRKIRKSEGGDDKPQEINESLIKTPRSLANPRIGFLNKKSRRSIDLVPSRAHDFVSKTIIKPEKCIACDKRVKFGRLALKCKECRMTCHVDCRDQTVILCSPLSNTPGSKGLVESVVGDFAPKEAPFIPPLILHCVLEVESRGLNEAGLYRLTCSEKEIKDLREKFLSGKGYPRVSKIDVHVLCGCIKDFLRSLKEPLITYKLWRDFVNAAEIVDVAHSVKVLQTLIEKLPLANRDTLAYLIRHLKLVSNLPNCKMSSCNLSRVFGPSIVGYSSIEPKPGLMMFKETKQQICILERLFKIPEDYWVSFIDVSPVDVQVLGATPEPRPAPQSLLGPLTLSDPSSSSGSKKFVSHTALGPRDKFHHRRQQFQLK